MLASTLSNLYLVAVTLLSRKTLEVDDGIHFCYPLEGGIFNLQRHSAHSKISSIVVCELQYADDTAVISLNLEGIQRTVKSSFEAYNRMGLAVSIPNTITMQSPFFHADLPPPPPPLPPPRVITAGKTPLKN